MTCPSIVGYDFTAGVWAAHGWGTCGGEILSGTSRLETAAAPAGQARKKARCRAAGHPGIRKELLQNDVIKNETDGPFLGRSVSFFAKPFWSSPALPG